jgi:hypothetical protein
MNNDDQTKLQDDNDLYDTPPSGESVDLEDTSDNTMMSDASKQSTVLITDSDEEETSPNTTAEAELELLDDVGFEDVPIDDSLDGEESVSGSAPSVTSDDDVDEMVENVFGNQPIPGEPFTMDDEIISDEMRRRGMDPAEYGYIDTDDDDEDDDFTDEDLVE